MRKEIIEIVEIPSGIEVELDDHKIVLKKQGNSVTRKYENFSVKKENNSLKLFCEKATKKEKKLIKTIAAHIRNIVIGFDKKYLYTLQVCSVHFPMTVTVDKAKKEIVVKNFLGEVKPRIAKLVEGAEVKVDKDIITVEGANKEAAGQTAANIEKSTRITNRDRRVFQDGIFIIEKPGENKK